MKKITLTFLLLILFYFYSFATIQESDSLRKKFYISQVEYKTSVKNFILPVSLITVGVVASITDHKDILSFDRSNHKSGDSSWDYLLLGSVAGSMFVFDRFVDAEHHPFDQGLLLLASAGLSIIPAYIVKESYHSFRPDGGLKSFPSGHTVTGFMIAHVLNKEFKNSNPWIAYGGYIVASMVSISRIAMNKHWISDVLAGAGMGILGTELAYLLYFPIRNKIADRLNRKFNQDISFSPVFSEEAFGLSLSVKF